MVLLFIGKYFDADFGIHAQRIKMNELHFIRIQIHG